MYSAWIGAQKPDIHAIKVSLEAQSLYDSSEKIIALNTKNGEDFTPLSIEAALLSNLYSLIPTKKRIETSELKTSDLSAQLTEDFQSIITEASKSIVFFVKPITLPEYAQNLNPLATSVANFLSSLPSDERFQLPHSITDLLAAESWSYTIYPPLLLLGPKAFTSQPWADLIRSPLASHMPALCDAICTDLAVTHIAVNAPIPPTTGPTAEPSTPTSSSSDKITTPNTIPNTLRSPTHLRPLHGSFPPHPASPTPTAFASALWVSARQNGITQVFAPQHTMFSRGNVTEKARVLGFSVPPSDDARRSGRGGKPSWTAVDLYAGIGYFAFSYAKAGAAVVLGWEVNGWSVESFVRGVEGNGWTAEVVREGGAEDIRALDGEPVGKDEGSGSRMGKRPRLVMFHETNTHAAQRVQSLRERIPPVRHVNCGYLPSSQASWGTAVRCLDPVLGGWVHAHENAGRHDILQRGREVVGEFRRLVGEVWAVGGEGTAEGGMGGGGINGGEKVEGWTVRCEHVEEVKTYAPGVVHVVFDIAICTRDNGSDTGP